MKTGSNLIISPRKKRRGRLEGATRNAVCGKGERIIGAGADERRSRGQRSPKVRNKGGVTTETVGAAASQRTETNPRTTKGITQEEDEAHSGL